MSAQDRYKKIVESLVNDETDQASELLHEAFVEKAREIWNDLLEQDELIEDEIEEDDIEEAIGDEKSGDFLDDIETDKDQIESEEAFGEGDDEEDEGELDPADMEAELELAEPEDMDAPEGEEGVEAAMDNVEDALAALKAEFASIMGDDEAEGDPEMDDPEMDMPEMESEELAFEETDEVDEEVEELDEAAELKAVSAPANTGGDDGKKSPIADLNKGKDPAKGTGENKDASAVDFAGGNEKGGKAPAPKAMSVTTPADAGSPKPAPKPKG
jgi:hypothetical protein